MIGRWLRIGSICELSNCQLHKISFVADSLAAIITRIDISTENITLSFSPFYYDELMKVCQSLSIPYIALNESFMHYDNIIHKSKNGLNSWRSSRILSCVTYMVSIQFNKINLSLIIQLFKYFNDQISPNPFPQELIDQLNETYYSERKYTISHKHHIFLSVEYESRCDCLSLLDWIGHSLRYDSLSDDLAPPLPLKSQFESAEPGSPFAIRVYESAIDIDHDTSLVSDLVSADCDIQSQEGFSALSYAMVTQPSDELMKLLLCFKANPFKRPLLNGGSGKYSFSPYELAYFFEQYERANIIVTELTWLTRNNLDLEQVSRQLKVIESGTSQCGNSIASYFRFNNQNEITTCLLPVKQLTPGKYGERAKAFKLFAEYFESVDTSNENELVTLFDKYFSNKKFIDLIYHGREMIGFNLIEFIQPPLSKNTVFLHCVIGVIKQEFRGYRLMTFLSFRLAYILQLIMQNKHVGIIFLSVHYNSYRMIDFEHFPKHQTDTMRALVKQLLDMILGKHYQYYQDRFTCYVVDDIRVKTAAKESDTRSLNEQYYTKQILGKTMAKMKEQSRSTPVAYFLGKENYLHERNATGSLGIDFDAHIAKFARTLKNLLMGDKIAQSQSPMNFGIFNRPGGCLLNSDMSLTHAGEVIFNKTGSKL